MRETTKYTLQTALRVVAMICDAEREWLAAQPYGPKHSSVAEEMGQKVRQMMDDLYPEIHQAPLSTAEALGWTRRERRDA